MKIAISAESSVDLTKELAAQFKINVVPFMVSLGSDCRPDGEITAKDIVSYVNATKTLPKTSAVNRFQFEEHFSNLLREHDAVIHVSISSEISSAYANACEAAKQFKNVFVIDSRSLSTGIALIAVYASSLAEKGFSADEIFEKCQKRVPKLQVSSVLTGLDYLYKGGRCSALKLFGANLLKLRVQIILKDGLCVPAKKYRGNIDACIDKYVSDTLATFNTPDLERVFVTTTTASPDKVERVAKVLENYGFKNVYRTYAGATVTSYCGEECLGIMYINDGGVTD